jgi:hypothetical protein
MSNEIVPKWKSAGFNSESEYDAYLDEKMANLQKQLKDLESASNKQNKKGKENTDESNSVN